MKEKHELKEQLGMVEMKLDGAMENNKRLTEEKGALEHKLHDTGDIPYLGFVAYHIWAYMTSSLDVQK